MSILIKLDEDNFFKKLKIDKNKENRLTILKNKFHKSVNLKEKESEDSWRVGLTCKNDCYYITTEILKCLQTNGYEWKIVSSSYKIKCRKKITSTEELGTLNNENEGEQTVNANLRLSVLIQIFSVI